MEQDFKKFTNFLIALGIDEIDHTNKSYLAHLIGVYRFLEIRGCTLEICRAGMFHSIYGTEIFQGFKLDVERRPEVRNLIGERAEHLAYWNCALDRASFDQAVLRGTAPFFITDRLTGKAIEHPLVDFNDLCRIHLYDWLEQVPRSAWWDYRRDGYERLAKRLGGIAQQTYDEVYAAAPPVSPDDSPAQH